MEAYHTFSNYYNPKDLNATKSYINGTLSCFCDDEYENYGLLTLFKSYRSDGMEKMPLEI